MWVQETLSDKLEKAIISKLPSDIPQRKWTNRRWTKEVKSAVRCVLKENGFKVYASNCDETDGTEWLYDLTGIEEENGYLRRVPLVLESEWKRWDTQENYEREILYDFRKLLVSRADHRIMVFEAKSEKEEKEVIEQLLQHVQNCQHSAKGDRYLFACCIQVEEKWEFDCSAYAVEG